MRWIAALILLLNAVAVGAESSAVLVFPFSQPPAETRYRFIAQAFQRNIVSEISRNGTRQAITATSATSRASLGVRPTLHAPGRPTIVSGAPRSTRSQFKYPRRHCVGPHARPALQHFALALQPLPPRHRSLRPRPRILRQHAYYLRPVLVY